MNRFSGALMTATLATYLLVVLCAMTAMTGGVEPVALGHYAAAAGVWLLLILPTALAWVERHERWVRIGTTAAVVLYPM